MGSGCSWLSCSVTVSGNCSSALSCTIFSVSHEVHVCCRSRHQPVFREERKRGWRWGQKKLTTTVPYFKKGKAFAEIPSCIIILVSLAILICKRDQENKELDPRAWIKPDTMHCSGLCSVVSH